MYDAIIAQVYNTNEEKNIGTGGTSRTRQDIGSIQAEIWNAITRSAYVQNLTPPEGKIHIY